MEIKVVCVCGQKFKFDVEPVNGAMPWAVKCPVCNADGTASANVLISQQLAMAPPAPVPFAALPRPIAVGAPVAVAAPAPVAVAAPAPVAIAAPSQRTAVVVKETTAFVKAMADDDSDTDTWKWWYYVILGVGVGIFSIWQVYDTGKIKELKYVLLGIIVVCIGLWQRKQKKAKR